MPVLAQEDSVRVPQPPGALPAVTKDTAPETTLSPVIVNDSARNKDSITRAVVTPSRAAQPRKDTGQTIIRPPALASADTAHMLQDTMPSAQPATVYGAYASALIQHHPYFNTTTEALHMPSRPFSPPDKDMLFYMLCGLLLILAALRMAFPRYFQYLFTAFWRPAFRQTQTRDHLQESGAATLAFNIFFAFSLGLFSYLTILYLRPNTPDTWLLFAASVLGVLLLYGGKYVIFNITGWMFGHREIVNTYLFIVLLINKVLGVLLIPFLLILAFADTELQQVAFIVSLILVIILFLYRYMLTFTGLRNDLKISALHLALFVLGFEIIPVLLIYRGLVLFFERSL